MKFKWNRYSIYGILFVLPAFVYILMVFFYPLILGFWNAFHNVNIVDDSRTWVGFGKFVYIFSRGEFIHSLAITLLYVSMIVPSLIILSLILANIIATTPRNWISNLLSTIFFLPIIASMVCAGMIWNWIMDPVLGIINNTISAIGIHHDLRWLRSPSSALYSVVIIGIWIRIGLDIIILISALQNVPSTYYEAAEIDGASQVRKFFRITLPLINPAIVMILIYEMIFAFNVFDQIFVTTRGGPSGATKTVMVYMLKDVFAQDYGAASAITVTMLVVLLLFSFLLQRFLRRAVEY